jgi:hypothetical protein
MTVTALDGLPVELSQLMRNGEEIAGPHPPPPGLYHDIPLARRTSQHTALLPGRITIDCQPMCTTGQITAAGLASWR